MNFKQFDRLVMEASYDEVKVIGRDVELDDHYAHIIGMTLKEKQAFVYAYLLKNERKWVENAKGIPTIYIRLGTPATVSD